MSYVVTPNSFQSPLNQQPETLFLTQNIQDPIVQQNFEIMNKVLTTRQNRIKRQANYVVGAAYSTPGAQFGANMGINPTGLQKPGALQVQIQTNGNPVQLKLAPFQYSNAAFFGVCSLYSLAPNTQVGLATVGWERITNGSAASSTVLCQIACGHFVFQSTAGAGLEQYNSVYPLPAFEFEDVVPAGLYTYQFFYTLNDTHSYIAISNLNVVAYELAG